MRASVVLCCFAFHSLGWRVYRRLLLILTVCLLFVETTLPNTSVLRGPPGIYFGFFIKGDGTPSEELVERWIRVVLGPRALGLFEDEEDDDDYDDDDNSNNGRGSMVGRRGLAEELKDGRLLVRLARAVGGARSAVMAEVCVCAYNAKRRVWVGGWVSVSLFVRGRVCVRVCLVCLGLVSCVFCVCACVRRRGDTTGESLLLSEQLLDYSEIRGYFTRAF